MTMKTVGTIASPLLIVIIHYVFIANCQRGNDRGSETIRSFGTKENRIDGRPNIPRPRSSSNWEEIFREKGKFSPQGDRRSHDSIFIPNTRSRTWNNGSDNRQPDYPHINPSVSTALSHRTGVTNPDRTISRRKDSHELLRHRETTKPTRNPLPNRSTRFQRPGSMVSSVPKYPRPRSNARENPVRPNPISVGPSSRRISDKTDTKFRPSLLNRSTQPQRLGSTISAIPRNPMPRHRDRENSARRNIDSNTPLSRRTSNRNTVQSGQPLSNPTQPRRHGASLSSVNNYPRTRNREFPLKGNPVSSVPISRRINDRESTRSRQSLQNQSLQHRRSGSPNSSISTYPTLYGRENSNTKPTRSGERFLNQLRRPGSPKSPVSSFPRPHTGENTARGTSISSASIAQRRQNKNTTTSRQQVPIKSSKGRRPGPSIPLRSKFRTPRTRETNRRKEPTPKAPIPLSRNIRTTTIPNVTNIISKITTPPINSTSTKGMKQKDLTTSSLQTYQKFYNLTMESCKAGKAYTCRSANKTMEPLICIPMDKRCDGTSHCPLGDDEEECLSPICQPSQVRCREGNCATVCNSVPECKHLEDELFCAPVCLEGQLRCPDGECATVCDGNRECKNGEDEHNCRELRPGQHVCKYGEVLCSDGKTCAKVCDGVTQCVDGADEQFSCTK